MIGTKEWVIRLLKYDKPNYAQKYTTDINLPNVFSASILAYSIDKQIELKLGKTTPITSEPKVFVGDVIHLYLQSRLPLTYQCNTELRYHIPFQWRSIPANEVVVICHPDAFSLEERNIIEFKTSFGPTSDGTITEYHKRQVCLYWSLIKQQFNVDCDARVIKLWAERTQTENGEIEHLRVSEWIAPAVEKEIYANDMVTRAIQCARELDRHYATQTQTK